MTAMDVQARRSHRSNGRVFARGWARALALVAAVILFGCYVPAPADHVVLTVPTSGGFVLAGEPVALDRLQPAIAARRAQAPRLVVEIRAVPEVPMPRIHEAVKAIEAAQARVSFAGNAQVLHGGTVTLPESAQASRAPASRASRPEAVMP